MGRQVKIGRLRPGSYQLARVTPTFGLSGISCAGTPPMKVSAGTYEPIQSGSAVAGTI